MRFFRVLAVAALIASGCQFVVSAQAAPPGALVLVQSDSVMAHEAWARASAGNATTGAAYVTLMGGGAPDQLVGVSTPVAATAEVHESFADAGVMKMRAAPSVTIPPGKTVTFAPGGYHVMLMGLKKPLVVGENFPLTLTFAHAAPVTVEVTVRALGRGPAAAAGHDQMK